MQKQKRIYEQIKEEDFNNIIKKIKSKKIIIACYLAYGCGMRLEEILNLKFDDINLDKHTIFIRQGKGNKDRVVNVPKYFKKEWLSYFPLQITRIAIQKSFLKASLITNINSIIYTYQTKKNQIRKKYRYHFHCLRHSFATRCIENNIPLNQLQLLLGHSNLSTTSNYVRANPDDAIKFILDKKI